MYCCLCKLGLDIYLHSRWKQMPEDNKYVAFCNFQICGIWGKHNCGNCFFNQLLICETLSLAIPCLGLLVTSHISKKNLYWTINETSLLLIGVVKPHLDLWSGNQVICWRMANKQTTREESQSSQDNLNFGSGKPLSPLPCRSPGNMMKWLSYLYIWVHSEPKNWQIVNC